MKKLIKNIKMYFNGIITTTMFSIFHLIEHSRDWFVEIREIIWNIIYWKKFEAKFRILEKEIDEYEKTKKIPHP